MYECLQVKFRSTDLYISWPSSSYSINKRSMSLKLEKRFICRGLFYIIFIYLIYLYERVRSHPLVHCPNADNSWDWCELKRLAGHSVQFSNVGGRNPFTWAVFTAFMICISGSHPPESGVSPRYCDRGGRHLSC